MAIDVSTLINMISQTTRGNRSIHKTAGGFRDPSHLPAGNKNPGGFSEPCKDPSVQRMHQISAKLNPNMNYIGALNQRVSGWASQRWPRVRITPYDRILNMVMDANDYEEIKVTAPPGTVEHRRQLGEQMGNPAGIRERRKTVREVLTGR